MRLSIVIRRIFGTFLKMRQVQSKQIAAKSNTYFTYHYAGRLWKLQRTNPRNDE